MCQEVLEIMQKMGLRTVEMQMALQCAPLLSGLKVSNLLIIAAEDIVKIKQIIKYSDVEYRILSVREEKATILLFRREELERYFEDERVRVLLAMMGYQDYSLQALLFCFQKRYIAYQKKEETFPHEMGFFLGYPIEDVIGFIKYQGKDFLCNGYWKVYDKPKQKTLLFQQFDRAQRLLVEYISQGGDLECVLQEGRECLLFSRRRQFAT